MALIYAILGQPPTLVFLPNRKPGLCGVCDVGRPDARDARSKSRCAATVVIAPHVTAFFVCIVAASVRARESHMGSRVRLSECSRALACRAEVRGLR